ncbi:autophagy protein 16, interacts with Atg12p-Atg5p [Emydomyces testavorans]|uniref:Autophagy protein 16, interacts with Atg12p-Atg5p n=1 Tax=Emydomyces testavorans TaxID=2070801 RepID=A0AAF0DLH0_9EURO|nr:autophagy protein 16, interacts with Atg12p-Atg5p [Emydomyces testavorans]
MSTWREEYYAALGVRDQREKANTSLYNAYTRLADRTSKLEAQPSVPTGPATPNPQHSPAPAASAKRASKRDTLPTQQPPNLADTLATARNELAEAQRSRTELVAQLKKTTEELEAAKKKATADNRRILDLSVERTQLQQRLKDRDEELRGKAKLLDDVQDELVSLNLQFNMSEDRAKKLEKDNKELIDRWMARVGQEAEAMNKASKFS